MKVLVTGAAGFIGMHTTIALLKRGDTVIGVDNLNDYYSVKLKEDRLENIKKQENADSFSFHKIDISDVEAFNELVKQTQPDCILNLAAQAGVRYSLTNPFVYEQANMKGFLSVLEAARHNNVKNVVYASSSSVYGGNDKVPFSADDRVDNPISLYAATKKANELYAHVYSHLFGISTIGLRFFTVYGPWGRPDMAAYIFANKINKDEPIDVFNHGKMKRDFTFVDDIVQGVIASIDLCPKINYEVFNLGNNNTEELGHFIKIIEDNLGKTAVKNMKDIQPGDVPATYADIEKSKEMLGYQPTTNIDVGLKKFLDWFKVYNK